MNKELSYEELIARYNELQLRTTRFASIEQELINTKDRLDHEIIIYKRLNEFNNAALKIESVDEFLAKVADAIIDTFETEIGAVLFVNESNSVENKFVLEGATKRNEQELKSLIGQLLDQGRMRLKEETIFFENKFDLGRGLFLRNIQINADCSISLAAVVSKEKEPFYTKLSERYEMHFSLFAQQVEAFLLNILIANENKDQLKVIADASLELRKLSLIATKTKNGVIITDNYGRIEWVNDSFTNTTGYSLEEVKGKKPKDFLQYEPLTNKEAREKLSNALSKKEYVEATILNISKSGRPYFNHLEITPVFDDAGNHINFIALQRDISEEEEYKNELLRINSRFELITDNSKIGIWEWNPETGRSIYNQVMKDILQIKDDESHTYYDRFIAYIHPEDRERSVQEAQEVMDGKRAALMHEFRLLFPDTGELRYVKGLVVAEKDIIGKIVRMVGSVMDITETRIYEDTLIEKNEELQKINGELDQFVYSVSHDLRSPLLSIKGLLSLIDLSMNNEELLRQYLGLIGTSVNRLDGTILEILDYSRNSRMDVQLSHFDLEKLVHEIYEDISHVSEIEMTFELNFKGSSEVYLDKTRLSTVMKNVISNAVKYRNKSIDNPFVHVNIENKGESVIVSIIDNGEGISKENQERVFEMFYRASSNSFGTGLGLYICKEIISKMGGDINLESETGKGTTITLTLPQTEV